MSLPQLLLVDDSEAVLEFEKAALAGRYLISVARDGKQALDKAAELHPDAILLDLSMPLLSGDQVLERLQQDPTLRDTPVLIISSERERGERCLGRGAAAFLPKPLKADLLVATVDRILDERRARARAQGLTILPVMVGNLEFGIPLADIHSVADQPTTQLLAGAPPHLSQFFEFHGQPMLLLSLADRLGVSYRNRPVDRKVVVISLEDKMIACAIDDISDPEEFEAADVMRREQIGGANENGHPSLKAMVHTSRGPMPVLDSAAAFSAETLVDFAKLVQEAQTAVDKATR